MQVNLNDTVKVKLTPYGREILQRREERLQRVFPELSIRIEEDTEGYYTTQVWQLFQEFGEFVRFGASILPFETNIIIIEESGK